MDNIEVLSERLNSGEHIKIKLLGDSITHGVGGSGFQMTKDIIIGEFGRNPNGYCWANLFRDYVEGNYNSSVVNNACSGTKIEFIIENFDMLVSTDDEFIICTIGTNNRHQFVSEGPKRSKEDFEQEFYNNVLLLNKMFCEHGKKVIFVANIPATPGNEEDDDGNYWYILHLDDINAIYKRAQEVAGFTLISLYDKFSDYVAQNNIPLRSLLSDGLHPNDEGYKVIFEILKDTMKI